MHVDVFTKRALCQHVAAGQCFLILILAAAAAPGWRSSSLLAQEPKAREAANTPAADQPKGLLFTDASGEPLEKILQRIYLSASLRVRPEFNNNLTDFDSGARDQSTFFSSRTRFGIGADLPMNLSAFIEAQNNSFWGDDSALSNVDTSGDDNVKMYQVYGEVRRIGDTGLSARVGRQELRYGTEMLLGDADFGPGLSHDAVKLMYEQDALSIHGWFAREVDQAGIPGGSPPGASPFLDNNVDFWGLYSTYTACKGTGLDAYYLYLRDPRSPGTGVSLPNDKRHTLGARGFVEPEIQMPIGVVLSSEFAWQFGHSGVAEHNIRAFAWETTADFSVKDCPTNPKAKIGYAFATGDSNPNDSRDETFIPLFEDNHPRLGYSDLFSLSNLHAITLVGSLKPFEHVEPGAGYYAFWVHRTQDGSPLKPGTSPGGNHFIGHEVNLFVNFDWTKHLGAQLAWAHLIPGEFIRNEFNSRDDADRLYLHLYASF